MKCIAGKRTARAVSSRAVCVNPEAEFVYPRVGQSGPRQLRCAFDQYAPFGLGGGASMVTPSPLRGRTGVVGGAGPGGGGGGGVGARRAGGGGGAAGGGALAHAAAIASRELTRTICFMGGRLHCFGRMPSPRWSSPSDAPLSAIERGVSICRCNRYASGSLRQLIASERPPRLLGRAQRRRLRFADPLGPAPSGRRKRRDKRRTCPSPSR